MSVKTGGVAVSDGFDPAPAAASIPAVAIDVATTVPSDAPRRWACSSTPDGAVPSEVGHDRAALTAAGFDGQAGPGARAAGGGRTARGASSAPVRRWMPTGCETRPAPSHARPGPRARLAVVVPAIDGIAADRAGQVVTEGVLLARYRYDVLQTKADGVGRSRPSR